MIAWFKRLFHSCDLPADGSAYKCPVCGSSWRQYAGEDYDIWWSRV